MLLVIAALLEVPTDSSQTWLPDELRANIADELDLEDALALLSQMLCITKVHRNSGKLEHTIRMVATRCHCGWCIV